MLRTSNAFQQLCFRPSPSRTSHVICIYNSHCICEEERFMFYVLLLFICQILSINCQCTYISFTIFLFFSILLRTFQIDLVFWWQTNWRRPKGIDSRVRRKFKGCTLMPNIGYGSDKKTRHYLPNGFKKFVVHNISELELLMMHNRYLSTWYVQDGCYTPIPYFIYIHYSKSLLMFYFWWFNAGLTVLKLPTMCQHRRGKLL